MNKSTKRLVAGGVIAGGLMLTAAGLVVGAGIAKADTLTGRETRFATTNGDAICVVFEKYPTAGGLAGIGQSIMNAGFTAPQAADIVVYSVESYCPVEIPAVLRAAAALAGTSTTGVSYVERGGGHGKK